MDVSDQGQFQKSASYYICISNRVETLVDEVNELLAAGWGVSGLLVVISAYGPPMFYQSMQNYPSKAPCTKLDKPIV